jgi:NAD(P)H-quinone oxidoreductase subunit 5
VLSWSWAIVAAPFLAGTAIILGLRGNKTLSMLASVGAVFYGFLHSLLILITFAKSETPAYQINWDWFNSASFNISMGLMVDHLAAVMLIVVTTISLFVQIYTHGYMREDAGYSRFYAYLSLFTGSMLGLVVSTNLFESFFFWELVGVCSYFLIGFWWHKNTAAEACLKAFVVNRIGDFGFLVGILLFLAATYGFWNGHPILMFADQAGFDLPHAIKWAADHGTLTAAGLTTISLWMLLGPMAKSAQLPLHVWLADAMEGPTPISALIHAATMVAAGVYLVARAYPIWLTPTGGTDSAGLAAVAWVGCITAFVAATIALTQFDIKRVLAWSTVSQLGYMFCGLGTGAYSAGMFHLFNHAFFKAMLFLGSGAVIHALHHCYSHDRELQKKLNEVSLMDRQIPPDQDLRNMGGLKEYMPITRLTFLIGCLSISGFPLMSGFFSKDDIISSCFKYTGPLHELLGPMLVVTAGMTAFYMFRAYFLTFEGTYRGKEKPHKEGLSVMNMPLIMLAIPSIFSGFLGANPEMFSQILGGAPHPLPNAFTSFLYWGAAPEFEAINPGIMAISTAFGLGGIALAWMVYANGLGLNTWCQNNLKPLYNLSWKKWFFDEAYIWASKRFFLPIFSFCWNLIDMTVVDNLVNLSSFATVGTGEMLRYSENGRAQWYALVIFGSVAALGLIYYFLRPLG